MRPDVASLLEGVGPGAHALATQILGNRDEAADAVQDALRAALENAGRFDPALGEQNTWFLTIVRNRCIDIVRRRVRRAEEVIDESQHAGGSEPGLTVEQDEMVAHLRRELAQLKPDQREILTLRDYLGLSYTEIAAVTGIADGTVMSRLHRARMALVARMRRYRT